MSILSLYHGSPDIIEMPEYGKGKAYNDYGRGFYCTEQRNLAEEWACSEGFDGYVNRYELETKGLRILNLSDEPYTILNWLAILMYHRKGRLSTPVSKHGHTYLIENFLPDFKEYDAIVGYRADDSYFSFARSFVNNEISLKQLGHAMRLGKRVEQFVLKSEKAFKTIKFVDYTVCNSSVYYGKRKARDNEARIAYQAQMADEDIDGIYMRDIIREEMKQGDKRLC